jgi:hypothetical protein
MKHPFLPLLLLLTALAPANAQQQDEAAYLKTLADRSQKIVNTLNISNPEASTRVTDILVNQYRSLGLIHDGKDTEDVKSLKLYNLHCEFIGQLAAELSPEQVDKVKDGMTYGVVQVTYNSYCDMIPSLKPDEKRQLMAWLVEAREHAMDAPSSNKKHEWFGKYKGRFNNYIAQRGYDSQKERQAWDERRKSAQDRQSKADLDVEKKAAEWIASLNLNDEAKTARLQTVIATHLKAVRDWHNTHDYNVVPEGINPKTGGGLAKTDRQIIIDSTLPKTVHEALMSGLRSDLTEPQIELILDKYTIGKVAFTMKAYREVLPDMTPEEETTILNYLKQAREESIDYKSMDQISAIFKIYKTKIELYLYQNDRNWKVLYKNYVDGLKKK